MTDIYCSICGEDFSQETDRAEVIVMYPEEEYAAREPWMAITANMIVHNSCYLDNDDVLERK